MDRTNESSMSPQSLDQRWVAKIFQELQGNYGTRFLNQWKTGQTLADGNDAGVVNAMAMWGKKLAGFADQPERIRRVLDTLPPEPPSLPQFVELCRMVPAAEKPAITYKPTAEDEARAREAAQKAKAALKPKISDGIDRPWATHPKTEMHLRFIFDAAARDARFRPCIDQMVEAGVCTAEGRLLRACT